MTIPPIPGETESYVFNHTMLRVKDIEKSLEFYTKALGMSLIRTSHASDFSLYFLAKLSNSQIEEWALLNDDEIVTKMRTATTFFLELTHNHGTEREQGMVYKNGNTDESRGYGHVAFTVPDLDAACKRMSDLGVTFRKRPEEGKMRNIAFIYDPDMYWVELIQQ